ncbi:aminopeptidase N [Croceicoccus sp. F390]|uniref:Aminopeptidase N n=1 Tax=Croceicoccus esteveae TaxID=3075597 RepID=A0ABU2ZE29_9SPHN|nr:aminopeptidase N [Croceicoccus sp. F390]MDT0574606.1 aminopeptidase N [Croceicoccus sp. F390]
MDISRNPAMPAGNPQLADAAPMPQQPLTVHRKDYRPPAWLVPEVHLTFDLALTCTCVTALMTVRRNPQAAREECICLLGDGIVAETVMVDGGIATGWHMEGDDLILPLAQDDAQITILTRLDPAANTQLMGFYASQGMLCTQCEAQGFRRISFFPDRPDVLSTYTVRMEGSAAQFPVLLSNGNCVQSGALDNGRHFAVWHDPWPKPSYLFALVAGRLVANRDDFTTRSGRKVDLAIWVRPGDEAGTAHAMQSLKHAMAWDEQVFGREYDLDVFNIVAVSDFNMGAMENKGLNIFNTRYILAEPDTATDADYDAIEGVVGHEYFHNWSGNRVTCRDWFQLSLKEGFTVLRDQLFSAAMGSDAVKRIEDVRILRAAQFPEDSGPLAHPIRPDSYQEISNFYTATVYNKGAEVIRMMRTMAGEDAFRKGSDLYFARHDGEAATCEDFISAMEDGAGLDLAGFRRWYEQSGTPHVSMTMKHDSSTGAVTLTFVQRLSASGDDQVPRPMVMPMKIALFDRSDSAPGEFRAQEHLLILDARECRFRFDGFGEAPMVSANRGFSAPINLDIAHDESRLQFLAMHDDDPFCRYEALQQILTTEVLATAAQGADTQRRRAITDIFSFTLADDRIDDLMRGELMTLPPISVLIETAAPADPVALQTARIALQAAIGTACADQLSAVHTRTAQHRYSLDAGSRGARKVRNHALFLLAAADGDAAARLAQRQYENADNMTDRQGALVAIAGVQTSLRDTLLEDFAQRYRDNALVIDKWYAIQAGAHHPHVLDQVSKLAKRDDFSLRNPNRVRALYMAMAGNPTAFHEASGAGYEMLARLILALDPINPQTAARFVPSLGRWRRIEPARSALMRDALKRLAASSYLSRDVREQVDKSLGTDAA